MAEHSIPPYAWTLLSRLDGVRSTGPGKWITRCPAHEDRGPSLSIRDTGERILIYCFAGCEADDVLAAVGLGWKDIYPDRWDAARLAQRPNKVLRRRLVDLDPLEVDRQVLRIAAAALKRGEALSVEDQARVQIAVERLECAA
ncbi:MULTISPECIES: hypothetical protein [unclassified Thiocapsa]|uniref:hypothetical protein n=1 Tax=unclassified Thiocapsa TaxID=2641286 RepID=UPI0035B33FAD